MTIEHELGKQMGKLARLVAATAVAVPAVLVGVAQPASADFYGKCGDGNYCIMGDINYGKCAAQWFYNDLNYADDYCYDSVIGYQADNAASSYFNNGAQSQYDDVVSFRHANNTSDRLWYVRRAEARAWVSPCIAEPCNDQASGHQWY